MGLIGNRFLGWDPWVASAAGAALALVYTVLGGLWADALTDTVQFVIMCVSVAVAAVAALGSVGDHAAIGARLGAEVLAPFGELTGAEVVVFAGIALTPLVEPAFYQRTFAARGSKQIVRALLIGLVLWAAYDWLVVYLGLAGRDMVASGRLPADLDESAVLLHVVQELLPTGLLGLFIAGCLAAAMSTIDSYTLIAAGNVVYDTVQPLRRRPLSDRALLRWTRLATVLTLAVAVALALRFERLRDAWIFMSTLLLSTALVPMLAALFLPRTPPRRAGQAGAIVGLAAAVLLFVAFEWLGKPLEEEGTLVLDLPVPFAEGLVPVQREAALLFTVPLSLLAFVLGWALPGKGGRA
jgi:SSS family solute:Na+ symporter